MWNIESSKTSTVSSLGRSVLVDRYRRDGATGSKCNWSENVVFGLMSQKICPPSLSALEQDDKSKFKKRE